MKVEYSSLAQQDFENIQEYLLHKFGWQVLEKFLDDWDKGIQILRSKIVFFEKYEDTSYRKFLVTKHNYVIYQYQEEVLKIFRIINNFQNPDDNYSSIAQS